MKAASTFPGSPRASGSSTRWGIAAGPGTMQHVVRAHRQRRLHAGEGLVGRGAQHHEVVGTPVRLLGDGVVEVGLHGIQRELCQARAQPGLHLLQIPSARAAALPVAEDVHPGLRQAGQAPAHVDPHRRVRRAVVQEEEAHAGVRECVEAPHPHPGGVAGAEREAAGLVLRAAGLHQTLSLPNGAGGAMARTPGSGGMRTRSRSKVPDEGRALHRALARAAASPARPARP